MQYKIYLEGWVCTSVISVNAGKTVTVVKFILASVCLGIYEDLIAELSHPNTRSSLGMSDHNDMKTTVLVMVTVFVTYLVSPSYHKGKLYSNTAFSE